MPSISYKQDLRLAADYLMFLTTIMGHIGNLLTTFYYMTWVTPHLVHKLEQPNRTSIHSIYRIFKTIGITTVKRDRVFNLKKKLYFLFQSHYTYCLKPSVTVQTSDHMLHTLYVFTQIE